MICYVSLSISLFVPIGGRLKLKKDMEVINLDNEDNDQYISRGVHEKKSFLELP